ncbi:MAG TPA: bifunctional demethylmenaquinone methyltransferase/2-methoxy-6-polyprenyl-1,4-benzoquinol methylase UbiE [Armatimonadota bacterium]|nr:bifunctional demethylmenaquinone methyltransferase/2-methoxy-6-polyprenyl-1,4-benzoquinol methylase UbiE [Armatimonadota bacterium]
MEQYPASEEGRREKSRTNRAMFDAIAQRYDVLNRIMSLGLDVRWRRRLVEWCTVGKGMKCLDLCCGTGDVTRELPRHGAQVTGLDASEHMLAIARSRETPGVHYVQGDALNLPFPDDSFDAVTIAFGNRNVASLEMLYAEMRRVAKPGGRVVSLEINRPANRLFAACFFFYFTHIPPLIARLFGANPSAYHYLPESVRHYPSPHTVAEIMQHAGFHDVAIERHLGGVFVLHRGLA